MLRPDDIMKASIWLAVAAFVLVLAAGCAKVGERRSVEHPVVPSAEPKDGAATPKKPTEAVPPQEARKPAEDQRPSTPQLKYIGRRVTLTWEDAGKPRMRATAIELTGNTVSGTASMKRVNAELYDDGKLVATLSAPSVLADEKTRVVTATGGVKVVSKVPDSSIRTINAEWIKWYTREDKMVGNGGITARGPVASIDAAAFTADTRLKTVRILADPSEARAVIGNR